MFPRVTFDEESEFRVRITVALLVFEIQHLARYSPDSRVGGMYITCIECISSNYEPKVGEERENERGCIHAHVKLI